MKKTLLLSVVASTMIMAGGDIAPVEPVVEAPVVVVAPAEAAKISGTAKLWYGTNDRGAANDLFGKSGAFGDAYVDLKYSRKVMDNVTLNAGVAGLSTLGLEKELVNATWVNHGPAGGGVEDAFWVNEANVVVGLPSINSFAKIGRQELDTPFFYSENWSIATNTFDAAVVGNTSLPDTTLVAAWVGRGNGAPGAGTGNVTLQNTSVNGGHTSFANNPAYAFAAINKSIENTALQGWFYKIPGVANAYWLQADTNIAGFDLGAQYAGTKHLPSSNKTSAWAVKLGYGMDNLSLYGAYSQRDNKNGIDISNIATGHRAGSQSRLYTEAYWNYGYVGMKNAKSFAVGASYDLGMAKLGAQYTQVDAGTTTANAAPAFGNTANTDLKEFAVTASTKIGPVNADLAYVYDKQGVAQNGANTALIMLSLPYSL